MDQTTTRSRDRLSEAKRLLLEKRIKGQAKPATPRNTIPRAGGGPVYPMSFAQERLWVLDQMEPGNPFYNIPAAMLVSTQVDVGLLERTFTEIVRRHEALRTTFRTDPHGTWQVIHPAPESFDLPMVDLLAIHGSGARDQVARLRLVRILIESRKLTIADHL